MKRIFGCIAASLCLTQALGAAQLDLPAASAQDPFARQQLSARSAALGVAFAALSNDLDALDENPAGLAQSRNWAVGLHHHQFLLDLSQQGAVVTGPWQSWGLGLGGRYLNYGSFEDRNETGDVTGQSQVADFSGRLGAGHQLWPGGDAGLTLGIATQKVAGDALVFSLSTGLETQLGKAWRAGLSTGYRATANNVPGGLEALRGGVAWSPTGGDLRGTLALGGALEEAGQLRLGIGGELTYLAYAVRASYQTKPGTESVDALGQWSLGLGLDQEDLRLDYAFRPLGDLGTDNRFSLSFLLPDAAKATTSAAPAPGPGFWQPGTWQLSLHGGATRYLPYSQAALQSLFNISGVTADFSPETALTGGIAAGLDLGSDWLVEVGADVLAPRRFHVRQAFFGTLFSDVDQNLQPLLFYGAASYRWPLAPGWSVSAGLQGGFGYLLSTVATEIPSFGIKSTVSGSSGAFSAMPLLRLQHDLGQAQSLGLELGYRLLSFSQASTSAASMDVGNFSGLNVALRWALAVRRGPAWLAPDRPPAPVLGSQDTPAETSRRWRNLGDLHLQEGRREEALAAYKKALELNPQDLELQEFVRSLEGTPTQP